MRTIAPRKNRFQEKPPVFRTPEILSDLVYRNFNELAHRAKLSEGTAIWANRMIREESFNKDELRAIKAIITDESPEAEVSAQILGSDTMLEWIEEVLSGRVTAQ